jgi:hypothetical protein
MAYGSSRSAFRLVEASDAAAALPGADELLCLGGDHRIRLDEGSGLNRYGCPPTPDPELLAFGSSTASTISTAAFAAIESLRARLDEACAEASEAEVYARELDRVRAELLELCGLTGAAEVVFAPSGTDLHLFAGQLIAGDPTRPALAIIGEETETGSGVPAALAGRRFSPSAPFDDAAQGDAAILGARAVHVTSVAARGPDGRPRPTEEADAEVEAVAEAAASRGRRLLLVLTDVSKTGLISPSPACAQRLCERLGEQVTVLVDACQLRLSPAALRQYAERGWMIAVTGSKFLTGPAFSAALFAPRALASSLARRVPPPGLRAFSTRADWPEGWAARVQLEERANFGLLLRWEAALEELRRFRAAPDAQVKAFFAGLGRTVAEAIEASPWLASLETRPLVRGLGADAGWDAAPSIFPFLLRRASSADAPWLSRSETDRVYRLLRQDLSRQAEGHPDARLRAAAGLRIEVGQPVAVGERDGVPVSALRLCASARLAAEVCSGEPRAAARVLDDARAVLAKAAWLAEAVAAGAL